MTTYVIQNFAWHVLDRHTHVSRDNPTIDRYRTLCGREFYTTYGHFFSEPQDWAGTRRCKQCQKKQEVGGKE